ncbi:MAG: hypothetical protein AAGJ40_05990 [Planctomycetota bacterium]
MPYPSSLTLDPPGSILVIGTTPLGLEAGLYGRFLGYDVQVIAGVDGWLPRPWCENALAQRIGPRFREDWFDRNWLEGRELRAAWGDPMPMMPDRCLSPLALSAIEAQSGQSLPKPLPITMQQWIEDALEPLTRTDLLRGRVDSEAMASRIWLIPVDVDQPDDDEPDDESASSIPPDFGIEIRRASQPEPSQETFECVIVADVAAASLPRPQDWGVGSDPPKYWFEIETTMHGEAEDMLRDGYRQITRIFADLAGRDHLDLYRPRRT